METGREGGRGGERSQTEDGQSPVAGVAHGPSHTDAAYLGEQGLVVSLQGAKLPPLLFDHLPLELNQVRLQLAVVRAESPTKREEKR